MTPTEAALRKALRSLQRPGGHFPGCAWPDGADQCSQPCQSCREALAAPPHGKDAGQEPKHLDDAFTVSLCPECGPNVGCDEDGLCPFCGATCVGNWLEEHKPIEALVEAQIERDALQAELAEYRVTRSTGKEWLEQIGALQAENAHLRAALDGTDCTYREGGDTRHCGLESPCFRCQRDALQAELTAENERAYDVRRLRALAILTGTHRGP